MGNKEIRFCQKCGAKVDEGANFCDKCGASLKEKMLKRKRINKILLVILVLVLLYSFSKYMVESYIKRLGVEKMYYIAVNQVTKERKNLDLAIEKTKNTIAENGKVLDETVITNTKKFIDKYEKEKITIGEIPETTEAMLEKTQYLSNVSKEYITKIKKLEGMVDAYKLSKKQYILLVNPAEEYVIEKLKTVEEVMGIEAVSKEEIEKEAKKENTKYKGCRARVYFESSTVDQEEFTRYGNTYTGVADKGNKCGGCVEVFATEEDARIREKYLAKFDNFIIKSGSHKVAGTCVIRTSDLLDSVSQKSLEKKVIDALAKIE